MNTIESIRAWLATDIERLNVRISDQLKTSNPMLRSIVTNSLKTKGKLIRPILVILSARLLGEVSDTVIDAAASVELLHNASLVHDDVVDLSDERRGQPTINAVWGNHVAVLVGDFFVSSSLQLAINTRNMSIVEQICSLGKNLSLGELDQVYTAYQHTLAEEDYYRIIGFKTASLFVACARMGSYAQGVDDSRTAAISRYAELFGLCFQIRDDIFDYFDDKTIGKPTGNDLREGKITLPLLHVLATGSGDEHARMVALSHKDALGEEDIATLIGYAVREGGIDYAYAEMQRMRDEAVQCLDVFPPSPERDALLELFDFTIARKS